MLLDLILIPVASLVFAIALFSNYLPKINSMKKAYNDLNSKIKDKLMDIPEAEREEFMGSLSSENRQFYHDILNDNMSFQGFSQFSSMQDQLQDTSPLDNIQFQEFNQWAMNESMKAVTPFDHGGYVQGAGFNPSDTMHQQMNHDMNQMNNSMDFGMHDSGMNDPFNGF